MGKKAKEHRKKVQARNQKLVAARKQLGKELQAMFNQQAGAHSQVPVYASTGDFIAKNYDKISEEGSVEYLEQHSGVAFSS